MLYKILLLFFLIINLINAQNGWIWQNPLPTGSELYSINIISNNNVVVDGESGTILSSNNSGDNWSIQRLNETGKIISSSYFSKNEGWAIAKSSIGPKLKEDFYRLFFISNGGDLWQEKKLKIDLPEGYKITQIVFINKTDGFIVANPNWTISDVNNDLQGLIYKTQDSGDTWTILNTNISRQFYQLYFINDSTAFLLTQSKYSHFDFEESTLYRTVNIGNTWQKLDGIGFKKVTFVTPEIGWSNNYKTIDGGKKWTKVYNMSPDSVSNISNIFYIDSVTAYALYNKSDTTQLIKTSNSGRSWLTVCELYKYSINDIKFINEQTGFLCGESGTLFQSKDSGENWTRIGSGTYSILNDVFFIDDYYGWIVGNDETILRTINSGDTWLKQTLPQNIQIPSNLTSVHFIDKYIGWIIGGGYIFHTDNGGEDWSLQYSVDLGEGSFQKICFINDTMGFVTGSSGSYPSLSGIFLITVDGGISWQKRYLDYPVFGLSFIDDQVGWICGSSIIGSTLNGGKDWQIESPSPWLFKEIQFIDENYGWVCSGSDGVFMITENGGISWEEIPFQDLSVLSLNAFTFINKNIGWAVAYGYGDVAKTIDGGKRWEFHSRLPVSYVNKAICSTNNYIWIVGKGGGVLRYNYLTKDTLQIKDKKVVGLFPNPINSKTTIFYDLSNEQTVTILLYDILGRKLENLYSGIGYNGMNFFEWKPSSYGSGIYIVQIHSNDYIKAIKCILLK